MTQLLAVGLSHKSAPLELREQVTLPPKRAARFAELLVGRDGIAEAIVLSTCNRTEIYVAATGAGAPRQTELIALLAADADLDPGRLAGFSYALRGEEVARHLFGVTAGLESMVLGESEIQGQVKRALEDALAAGTTGPLASRLFSSALKAGKRVRSETGLGAARTSVASVGVDLAVKALGSLEDRTVTMIGAGETGETAAHALAHRGAKPVLIAHLRVERAREIAARIGGRVDSFEHLDARIATSDVVVSATASPHYVVHEREVREIMARRSRPLVLIDLAVPRDIEPGCRDVEGVEMYDIDDLRPVVDRTLSLRAAERDAAETIIEQEIERFEQWLRGRRERDPAEPVRALRVAASSDVP